MKAWGVYDRHRPTNHRCQQTVELGDIENAFVLAVGYRILVDAIEQNHLHAFEFLVAQRVRKVGDRLPHNELFS